MQNRLLRAGLVAVLVLLVGGVGTVQAGVGLAVAVLLSVEVASGLYGRYLHRHVVRLGRGDETLPVGGRLLTATKEMLFSRWRQVHVVLTVVTSIVLTLHIITAIGD